MLAGTARRLQRLLAERAGEDEDALACDEPLLALLAAASLRGRSAGYDRLESGHPEILLITAEPSRSITAAGWRPVCREELYST